MQANISTMNKELHTPLICAAIRGNTSAYEALVSRASVTDTDANGRNIVHISADKNHGEFLKVNITPLPQRSDIIIEIHILML